MLVSSGSDPFGPTLRRSRIGYRVIRLADRQGLWILRRIAEQRAAVSQRRLRIWRRFARNVRAAGHHGDERPRYDQRQGNMHKEKPDDRGHAEEVDEACALEVAEQ